MGFDEVLKLSDHNIAFAGEERYNRRAVIVFAHFLQLTDLDQ